ncbi:MAG: hypothetical protein JWP02_1964 [Acidimicrobiales bacterium]|nr:hypothetical protein [Acidimicrobiales bacterium]
MADSTGRGAPSRALAGIIVVLTLSAVAVPTAVALDLSSVVSLTPVKKAVDAVVPVCPPTAPGVARCGALLLTDQRLWRNAVVPPVPAPGDILGLLTTTTTTRPATTTTTRATTTTSTTNPPTTTTSPTTSSTSTTKPSTTTTTPATTTTTPAPHNGFGADDLQSAYGLTAAAAGGGGGGQTVAIVDAFDHPHAEADLGVYRSYYGLPACTAANGCFRKVDQRGGTTYPAVDTGWAQETSLDLDMVSASCPNCHILLVESDTAGTGDMAEAVNTAARLGANAISNSYGVTEAVYALAPDDAAYRHPGIAITASTGDNGYGVQFPASSDAVTAVGGTSLSKSTGSRGWSERAWSGAGSGCSSFFAKPSWQNDSGCSKRAIADVSAVADPATGVAVYDSVDDGAGHHGWLVFGGTSVGAPLIAGVYALAGNASTAGPGYPYAHTGSLNDVTSGSNGACVPTYLCTAGPGYDGPTGLGTPAGVGAF